MFFITENTNILKAPLKYRGYQIGYDYEHMTYVVSKDLNDTRSNRTEVESVIEGIHFINDLLEGLTINPAFPEVFIGIKPMDRGHGKRVILITDKATGRRFMLKQEF